MNNIRQRLQSTFNKEVFIDNDARMQAYGEYMFGEARGNDNAIVINWNWGLGLGMILNGECYSGSTGFAGEFSHIRLDEEGELCICGKRGCLETLASATALITMAKEGIAAGKVSQLTEKFKDDIDNMMPKNIIKAAKKGDEFAISILNKVGMAMGKGLSLIIQLLNPKVIVLSGQLSKANQYVLTPIQQSLNKHCLENISRNIEIKLSKHGEDSGLLGITAMLYHRLFSGIFENFEFNNKQVM
jgi:predicted NBD/HSP70 family sugar kinase